MKLLVSIILLGCVFGELALENQLKIGQACQSNGGFTISSFNVSPYPPQGCSPQQLTITGTFTQSACPSQIHISEVYNRRQSYNQDIDLSGCAISGQTVTYQYPFTPYQCNSGVYDIQLTLNTQNPQQRLACWQYQYNI